uniref:DUF19 domain-containing protein n=1 Tax=Toxocara canis TaxID=6265 RepID=A0A183U5E3_TOXCA
LFPLFNYSASEVSDICEVLELVDLVDQQFGVICSQITPDGLTESYSCLRSVLFSNQDCFALIPGRNVPGLSKENKCEHMQQFYDCMRTQVQTRCDDESHTLFTNIIDNYGCSVRIAERVFLFELKSVLFYIIRLPSPPGRQSLEKG